jgi:hypothetical protein
MRKSNIDDMNSELRVKVWCFNATLNNISVISRRSVLLVEQLLVQSLSINTKVVSSNLGYGEVYSIKHYMIKLVSDLRQVAGFLRVLRFSPPIKLIVAI